MVGRQTDSGRPALVEAGPIAGRRSVAVPAAIGPLPFEERLDEWFHAFIRRVAETAGDVEPVALHGCIGEVEAIVAQPLRRLEAARVGDPGQLNVDRLVELGASVGPVDRQGEVRQADQAPMQAPPFAVRVLLCLGREVEKGGDNRPIPGGFAVALDLCACLWLAQQPRPRAVTDRRLIGLEQPVDGSVAFGHANTLLVGLLSARISFV